MLRSLKTYLDLLRDRRHLKHYPAVLARYKRLLAFQLQQCGVSIHKLIAKGVVRLKAGRCELTVVSSKVEDAPSFFVGKLVELLVRSAHHTKHRLTDRRHLQRGSFRIAGLGRLVQHGQEGFDVFIESHGHGMRVAARTEVGKEQVSRSTPWLSGHFNSIPPHRLERLN